MSSTADGTIGTDNNSLLGTPYSTALDGNLINTVQAWCDGTANDGWILQQEGRSGYYGDLEGLWMAGTNTASEPQERPFLSVSYIPPPTISSFTTSATLKSDGKYHIKEGQPWWSVWGLRMPGRAITSPIVSMASAWEPRAAARCRPC